MKFRIIYLLFFILYAEISFSQTNEVYFNAILPECVNISPCQYPFTNIDTFEAGIDYGCLYTHPYPDWFAVYVSRSGNIILNISSPENYDLDFACWGPFPFQYIPPNTSYFSDQCNTCPNNTDNPSFYPSGNLIDCSYSANTFETLHISNALKGQYYYLMVSHASPDAGHISFAVQTPSEPAGQLNGAFLTIENYTVLPCDSTNNFYSLFVHYYLHTGLTCICPDLLTVTDITTGQTINTTAWSFSQVFDSLNSDGLVHTFVLNWQNIATDTIQFTAPAPCLSEVPEDSVRIDSVAINSCNPINNYYSMEVRYSIYTDSTIVPPDSIWVTLYPDSLSEQFSTSVQQFTMDSLNSDGLVHTFVLNWRNNATDTIQFTAPAPCLSEVPEDSVRIDSVAISACNSVNNYYSIEVEYSIYTDSTIVSPDSIMVFLYPDSLSEQFSTSVQQFTMDSLNSDGLVHNFVLNWRNNATDTIQFTAPAPCFSEVPEDSVRIDSVAISTCNPVNDYYSIEVKYSIYTDSTIVSPDSIWVTLYPDSLSEEFLASAQTITLDSLNSDGLEHSIVIEWGDNSDTIFYQAPFDCDSVTNIFNDEKLSPVKVFPNPFNSELKLLFGNKLYTSPVVISIYNVYGMLVYNEIAKEKECAISTKSFNSGLYLLRVTLGDVVKEFTICKE